MTWKKFAKAPPALCALTLILRPLPEILRSGLQNFSTPTQGSTWIQRAHEPGRAAFRSHGRGRCRLCVGKADRSARTTDDSLARRRNWSPSCRRATNSPKEPPCRLLISCHTRSLLAQGTGHCSRFTAATRGHWVKRFAFAPTRPASRLCLTWWALASVYRSFPAVRSIRFRGICISRRDRSPRVGRSES